VAILLNLVKSLLNQYCGAISTSFHLPRYVKDPTSHTCSFDKYNVYVYNECLLAKRKH